MTIRIFTTKDLTCGFDDDYQVEASEGFQAEEGNVETESGGEENEGSDHQTTYCREEPRHWKQTLKYLL